MIRRYSPARSRKERIMPRFLLIPVAGAIMIASICHGSQVGEVVEQFMTPDYPTGLAWDGESIWLADRDCEWIYALSPSSGSLLDSVPCPSFSPLGLAFGDGCLWVSGYYEDGIYKVDLDSRRVVDVISAPGQLTIGLAWEDGYLWACDASAKEIVKLDPADGTPIRSIKSPSRYAHGLAFDGKYLWVSDRSHDKIYKVEPEKGWVVLAIDSPGPYPRGLAPDGKHIWNVDYETDSLYAFHATGAGDAILESPKKASVRFTVKVRCRGPDPVDECDVYLALPHSDLDHQVILAEPAFKPEPSGFVTDKWGQDCAHFALTDIRAGETRRVSYETEVEIHARHQIIIPETVESLERIPRDLKRRYTVDGARLLIEDPVIQNAIQEAVGDEKNPYWIVRRIFEYVNDHVDYERVGGWDTAPNVLERGTGSCSEYSFVFMAMARGAGIPTRFSAGVCERGDEASMDDVFHRWTEVYLPGYGWVRVDASAGEGEWQADRLKAIGSYPNRYLITTIGGGDSEYLGWSYNYGLTYTYAGRSEVDVSAYADWEPLE
jgi:hypothetical protein